MSKRSPKITASSWGEVRVEGHQRRFKDVKLFPGGVREWNWNETGTRHVPGIQPADIYELLENGASRVVLSTGREHRLHVATVTYKWLSEQGIRSDVLPTKEAIELYNELTEKEPIGALIHSTC